MIEELGLEAATRAERLALDAIDWDAVRVAYEDGDETLVQICERFGITPGALNHRVQIGVWRLRKLRNAVTGEALTKRMFRLLTRQVTAMEKATEPMNEKDAAVLGRLAGTLERLMEIEAKAPAKTRAVRDTAEMQELRQKIARRLDDLGDQ